MMKRAVLIMALAMLAAPVVAEDEAPLVIESGDPDVRTLEDSRGKIEEYRLNGVLYMIKITPKGGKPYYLVDADGDGELESRRNELDPDVMVPSWMLFRW